MVRVPKQQSLILLVTIVLACGICASAQEPAEKSKSAHAETTLAEVRDMRRALLVVFKSRIIDASGGERAIIDDVLKADPEPKGRYRWVYTELAKKLNKYMRKYRSLSAADGLADAEYVIFFNVVEFRRILDVTYPYGELFVIVKGSPEELKPPRVVWRANKVLFAGDAIGDLIKELKTVRGES
jgi:hypothetical protein